MLIAIDWSIKKSSDNTYQQVQNNSTFPFTLSKDYI